VRSWIDGQRALAALAERQLFFVGGAPRSGTTWVQLLLDSHPEVSCRGEALFGSALAAPLDRVLNERRTALDAKNKALFEGIGGYKLPEQDDIEFLLGAAILLALERQAADGSHKAIGEKTPENVFLFARLKRIFPAAKLIALARDPRDVLTSAWHFFRPSKPGQDENAAKAAYIRSAIPSLNQGAKTILDLATQHPESCLVATYEELHRTPEPVAERFFRFLGVSADASIVADCVSRNSFGTLSTRRSTHSATGRPFFRKGVVGDWRSTLPPELNALILKELGWMFPRFGWEP
jgi:hypothetical protein